MDSVAKVLSSNSVKPEWNINRYTMLSSKTTMACTLAVMFCSIVMCQSLLQNIWMPDAQLAVYGIASENTKIPVDPF